MVCNAENSAGGSGLTIKCHEELEEAGVDVFTLGDHVYRKDEIFTSFDRSDRLLQGGELSPDSPGGEFVVVAGEGWHAWSGSSRLMGRTFMKPVDDPFSRRTGSWRNASSGQGILVNLHAEATSDKQLLGRYLDGRVSAVLGTHTHVATADEQILPNGTAYQTDVGMTGPYDSILGQRYDRVLASTLTASPTIRRRLTGDPGSVVPWWHGRTPVSGRPETIRRVSVDQEATQRLMTGDLSAAGLGIAGDPEAPRRAVPAPL